MSAFQGNAWLHAGITRGYNQTPRAACGNHEATYRGQDFGTMGQGGGEECAIAGAKNVRGTRYQAGSP